VHFNFLVTIHKMCESNYGILNKEKGGKKEAQIHRAITAVTMGIQTENKATKVHNKIIKEKRESGTEKARKRENREKNKALSDSQSTKGVIRAYCTPWYKQHSLHIQNENKI
jgi:hypothetical protein